MIKHRAGNQNNDSVVEFPQANIVAAEAMSRILASSIGPVSHDKLVIQQLETREDQSPAPSYDDYVITSDGATILNKLPIEHPIGNIICRTVGPEQTDTETIEGAQIPDGISTTVFLLSALLSEAESLLDTGLHPHTVFTGYKKALEVALQTIDDQNRKLPLELESKSAAWCVARTALTGNDLAGFADIWSDIAVEVADTVGMPNEVTLAVRATRRGSIADSRLIPGAVLDRNKVCHSEMPTRIENANILVLSGYDSGGGLQDPDTLDIRVETDNPDNLAKIDDPLIDRRKKVVETLVSEGVDVVIARQGIIPEYQRLLANNGIMGIRGVNRLDLQQVALSTGASLVQDITDISDADLGKAGVIEEVKGDLRPGSKRTRKMIVIDECTDPDSVCIQLHGVGGQLSDQATRILRQATAAVARAKGEGGSVPGIIPGGGAIDIRISQKIREASISEGSKQGLAMEAFADATEKIVAALARNAGQDAINTITEIKAKQESGSQSTGLVLPDGKITDVFSAGVVDPTSIRKEIYTTATELATLILRVDDAVDAEFTEAAPDPDDVIYDDVAERQNDYLKDNPDSHRFDDI